MSNIVFLESVLRPRENKKMRALERRVTEVPLEDPLKSLRSEVLLRG